MDLSRRRCLSFSAGAGAGTAMGTLVGLGANLIPPTGRAQELRIKGAKVTPSICPCCSVGCATLG
jgi:formate dehydrogenase major subunit